MVHVGRYAVGPAAVLKQKIVQWSDRQIPLNVVQRIPLLGYLDIIEGHLQM